MPGFYFNVFKTSDTGLLALKYENKINTFLPENPPPPAVTCAAS